MTLLLYKRIVVHIQSTATSHVQLWDLREPRRTGDWADVHTLPVRDVDFAHQTQDVLVSTGDDSRLRIWDLRWAIMKQQRPARLKFLYDSYRARRRRDVSCRWAVADPDNQAP